MSAKVRTPYWHGMLCAETRDEIAERMQDVLADHYFTVVECNSFSEESERFTAVDVRPSQWLDSPIRSYADPQIPGISWTTPSWSMGVHSTATTQPEAREGRPHKYVHFTFERDEIVIDHYAPAGYRLRWIFAVERHDREDES